MSEDSSDGTQFHLLRQGAGTGRLPIPLLLAGTALAGMDYELEGLPGETVRRELVLERGEWEKTVRLLPQRNLESESDETVSISILPRVDYAIARSAVSITLMNVPYVPTAYETWARAQFPAHAPAALRAATADYDRDGACNLLEFLCGTHPADARSSPNEALRMATENGHAVLRFTLLDRPGKISLDLLASERPDGGFATTGDTFALETTRPQPGTVEYRFRSRGPLSDVAPRQFYRVAVTYGQ